MTAIPDLPVVAAVPERDALILAARQVLGCALADIEAHPGRSLLRLEKASREFRKLLVIFDPGDETLDGDTEDEDCPESLASEALHAHCTLA